MTDGAIAQFTLPREGLDIVLPLNVVIDAGGAIVHAGPTMKKLFGDHALVGVSFFGAFDVRRPARAQRAADLLDRHEGALRVVPRHDPETPMRGCAAPLEGGAILVALSLGVSVVEAVRKYDLAGRDFSAADPTIEMLYLIEAKSAVLEESKRLNQRLQGAKIAAEEQAFTDTLTGLKNRRAMDHVLGRLSTVGNMSEPFGLMHIDLDFFKEVNDTYGHAAGDHVLQEVARILVEETRADDTVARIGGDEFVVIIRNCRSLDILDGIARRIIERLERPIMFQGKPCRVSASIGTTISTAYDRIDPDRMLHDADTALYESKARGRSCHTFFGNAGRASPDQTATH
ncbi:MAG: GGDEF domain-containing protein [Alphaproteobacteria bacterium]|nr:MAG: GGDEF domain-containing protein [Alphaproteobacteria bacterium]